MSQSSINKQSPPPRRGPGGPVLIGGEKAKNFKTTIKRLLAYLEPFKFQIIVVIFLQSLVLLLVFSVPNYLDRPPQRSLKAWSQKYLVVQALILKAFHKS